MKPYAYRLATSAAEIDRTTWEAICGPARHPFMEFRFLETVETAFSESARFWYATLFDDDGQPLCCAGFSLYEVDGAVLAPPGAQRFVNAMRRWVPRFFRFPVLLGGSPVSTSGSQLVVTDQADSRRLAMTLDQIAADLAKKCRALFISFKEFDPPLVERLKPLEDFGYRRAHSVTAHRLYGGFASWNAYYESRSKRTRANIRRHFRKFDAAGLRCVAYRGRDDVAPLFTDEVHRLYLNVFERSKTKFEVVPLEFFSELARRLPDESCFTFVFRDEKPVGFCCGLASQGAHTLLYCGLDYSINAEADLYFNIIYRGLEQGLAAGPEIVYVGATADEFKRHMGCTPIPMSIYIKPRGLVNSFVFHRLFHMLFPERSADAPAGDDRQPTEPPETAEAGNDGKPETRHEASPADAPRN